jgi:hypothetical protein
LKTALGDDAVRFGRSVAKPLVVDRELRVRFANDDKLHLAKRKSAERARNGLIGAKKTNAPLATLVSLLKTNKNGAFHEVTWQFGITPPEKELERLDHFRFEDLSSQLQEVVRAQLRASGDISAVIETDTEFLLMLAKEKTAETLSAAILSVPKSSFDQWLQSLP